MAEKRRSGAGRGLAGWWRGHRPTTRRLAQLYAALLYNAHLRGFIEGGIDTGAQKALCVPGLNCYSCPGAIGACPLGALQNALGETGHRAPWYVLGMLALFGVALGRTVCGWLCPMGLLQEALHGLPTLKLRKGALSQVLSGVKYAVLGMLAVALPLWYGLRHGVVVPGFCKYVCPAGTLEGALGLLANPKNDALFAQLGGLFTRKFAVMLGIGLGCVFMYRFFCRFLCPLGALYGLFNRFAISGAKVDASRCDGCGACVRACPMDIRRVGDRECVACGRCVGVCPHGAIAVKCGRWTLAGPQKRAPGRARLAARGAALAVLALALVWFNGASGRPAGGASDAGVAQPAAQDDAPAGYEVGCRLPDFSAPLIDGGEFHLADCRGKVVFINLWGIHCKPCVDELPYFEALAENHSDVEVLAIHLGLFHTREQVAEFLADKGWERLKFALDGQDQPLFAIVNGSSVLPQTVVLDGAGVVVFNERRSMSYEMLEALLAQAKGEAL